MIKEKVVYHIKEEQYPMRPRERLNIFGPEKLSEQELLAILPEQAVKRKCYGTCCTGFDNL